MPFPSYVHTIIPNDTTQFWPVQSQGINECGCAAAANALNLLLHKQQFQKDAFVHEAGMFFQRDWGGTPSFVTGWLIKRHGFGTHFGALEGEHRELVLRDLLNRHIPVCIELGANKVGPLTVFGQHAVVLVGYSTPYTDANGQPHEEYYFVDSEWPPDLHNFGLHTNDVDRNGDGVVESFPGNRTLERAEFVQNYPTGIYFPVFPNQAEHDAWYKAHIAKRRGPPLIGSLTSRYLTGSLDRWKG